MASPHLTLYTTPPAGSLPSTDPDSLYLTAYLHLAARPSDFKLVAGDYGVNGGDLPAVEQGGDLVPKHQLPILGIVRDLDAPLTSAQRAETLIWTAFIEESLTDLVNHSLYSLPPNYPNFLGPAQAKHLSYPQKLYTPQRIRSIHQIRLERVGLWGLGGLNYGDAQDLDRQRLEESTVTASGGTTVPKAWSGWNAGVEAEKRKRIFDHDELMNRSRRVLEPLSNLLGPKDFFFGTSPTSLDLQLYAHLSLLLSIPLPNPLLGDLVKSSFPGLAAHHARLSAIIPWETFTPTLAPDVASRSAGTQKKTPNSKSEKDKRFQRGRWLWFAGVAAAFVGYVLTSGIVAVEFGEEGEEDDEEEDEEEEEDESILPVEDDEDEDEDEDE